ncbi:MAG: hypothetical protein HY059_05055 [Proteobacteria bacterium]|nr:hypothetical protein [Pseudomonadota bacterium]
MRRLAAAAAIGIVSAAPGRAQLALPEAIVARANAGRVEFLRAASEVAAFAPRLPKREQLFPYLDILDELERAAAGYDFATMGVDPVKELGATLTANAAKWVRLDKDSPQLLRNFFKWSLNDARSAVAGESPSYLTGAETPEELLAWNRGTRLSLALLKEAKADRSVRAAYEDLQGIVIRSMLARGRSLSDKELDEALRGADSAGALREVILFLETRTAAPTDPGYRMQLARWALAAGAAARSLSPAAPLSLEADAGEALLLVLGRSLHEGDTLEGLDARAVVSGLLPGQAAALLGQFVALFAERPVPLGQREFVRAVLMQVEVRYPYLVSLVPRCRALKGLEDRAAASSAAP